jgi:hypothetical protein
MAEIHTLIPADLTDRPALVLRQALEHGCDPVIVLGYDKRGHEYFAASCADAHQILWLLERLKQKLLT